MNKTPKCPMCGSEEVLEIFYGDPTEELFKKAELGEVKLGGCKIQDDNYYCKRCKHNFR